MRRLPWLLLAVLVTGCNPYVAAISVVSESYSIAASDRSLATQASDAAIEAKIQAHLLQSPVPGTGHLDALCRQGVVLLAGVVPPGSDAGHAAVKIARATAGVGRVETFFVARQPSELSDFETKEKIKAVFVADPNLTEGQVTVEVYGGHVVLVGVVDTPEQIDEFVQDANTVSGVVSVRSYIQLAP